MLKVWLPVCGTVDPLVGEAYWKEWGQWEFPFEVGIGTQPLPIFASLQPYRPLPPDAPSNRVKQPWVQIPKTASQNKSALFWFLSGMCHRNRRLTHLANLFSLLSHPPDLCTSANLGFLWFLRDAMCLPISGPLSEEASMLSYILIWRFYYYLGMVRPIDQVTPVFKKTVC